MSHILPVQVNRSMIWEGSACYFWIVTSQYQEGQEPQQGQGVQQQGQLDGACNQQKHLLISNETRNIQGTLSRIF